MEDLHQSRSAIFHYCLCFSKYLIEESNMSFIDGLQHDFTGFAGCVTCHRRFDALPAVSCPLADQIAEAAMKDLVIELNVSLLLPPRADQVVKSNPSRSRSQQIAKPTSKYSPVMLWKWQADLLDPAIVFPASTYHLVSELLNQPPSMCW